GGRRREGLAGDALLDVVRLGREGQEGLVLRLPAEPGDAAVIAAGVDAARPSSVRASADPHGLTAGTPRVAVVHDRLVGDPLDQAGPEHGRRDAEDDVPAGHLAFERRLGEATARRLAP